MPVTHYRLDVPLYTVDSNFGAEIEVPDGARWRNAGGIFRNADGNWVVYSAADAGTPFAEGPDAPALIEKLIEET